MEQEQDRRETDCDRRESGPRRKEDMRKRIEFVLQLAGVIGVFYAASTLILRDVLNVDTIGNREKSRLVAVAFDAQRVIDSLQWVAIRQQSEATVWMLCPLYKQGRPHDDLPPICAKGNVR